MEQVKLKAPFPYFGGKSKIAHLVWERFGDVPNYIEPFSGSAAVLLARPHKPKVETLNDTNGFVVNAWRAIKSDPEAVAQYADRPVFENDMHAIHAWLKSRRDDLVARLEGDPEYYDAKIAGWWLWGTSIWIGPGFCCTPGPWHVVDGKLVKLDKGSASGGIRRSAPRLGCKNGVLKQTYAEPGSLASYMKLLCDRLRYVRVICGDWQRVVRSRTITTGNGLTGIFLDPPYGGEELDYHYDRADQNMSDTELWDSVREWALANGDSPLMRIAVCGYEPEDKFPPTWECVRWKNNGGYANQRRRGRNQNKYRECVWFSPHCLKPTLPLEVGDQECK